MRARIGRLITGFSETTRRVLLREVQAQAICTVSIGKDDKLAAIVREGRQRPVYSVIH